MRGGPHGVREDSSDRRVLRTRASLRRAVVALVLEKGYQSVTIDDIVSRAQVTRTSFYAHFRDKEHLFASVADDFADEALAAFAAAGGTDNDPTGRRLVVLFEMAAASPLLFRLILRGEGDGAARRRLEARITDEVASAIDFYVVRFGLVPRMSTELTGVLIVGEILAVLAWWVEQDPPALGADAVVQRLRADTLHGRLWAIGAPVAYIQSTLPDPFDADPLIADPPPTRLPTDRPRGGWRPCSSPPRSRSSRCRA